MAASFSALPNSSRDSDSGPCSRPCRSICWPDGGALVEELLLDDGRARVARGQPQRHDELGVDERTQHPVGDEERRARQHVAPVGRVPTRAHPGELGGELGAVGLAVGEEELELEQVAQRERGVPAVFGLGEQHQLDDRPVDEVVDRGVAVERRDEVLAALDRVHRLLAARVDRHDLRLRQARPARAARPVSVDSASTASTRLRSSR